MPRVGNKFKAIKELIPGWGVPGGRRVPLQAASRSNRPRMPLKNQKSECIPNHPESRKSAPWTLLWLDFWFFINSFGVKISMPLREPPIPRMLQQVSSDSSLCMPWIYIYLRIQFRPGFGICFWPSMNIRPLWQAFRDTSGRFRCQLRLQAFWWAFGVVSNKSLLPGDVPATICRASNHIQSHLCSDF